MKTTKINFIALAFLAILSVSCSFFGGTSEYKPASEEFVKVDSEPYIDLYKLAKNVVYPKDAKSAGIEGEVIVRVLVSPKGECEECFVESSTNKIFNESALEAVKKTEFTPAVSNGKKVYCWISIPIQYKLK